MFNKLFHKIAFGFVQFTAPKFGMTEGAKTYGKNRQLEGELVRGLITDQSKLSGISFGDTNVGKSGCEAVALYNALLLRGRPKALSDIIRDLQDAQALVNRGKWGANPFDIARVMREYRLDYEPMETITEAEEKMRPGDLLLVTVWNQGRRPLQGIHGYIIEMKAPDDYLVYNRVYLNHPEKKTTLRDAIGEGSYIVGYLIR